jgi:hypothetical protein
MAGQCSAEQPNSRRDPALIHHGPHPAASIVYAKACPRTK